MYKKTARTVSNVKKVAVKILNIMPYCPKKSHASKIATGLLMLLAIVFIAPTPVYATHAAAATTFLTNSIGYLGMMVIFIGAGLGIWGVVNLVEGYGNDQPGAKSQGMKQLMAGGALVIIGIGLPVLLGPLLVA